MIATFLACVFGKQTRTTKHAVIRAIPLILSLAMGLISQAQEQRVKVLMLGDNGFHKPSVFYRTLKEPLSKYDIDVDYTDQLTDINAENLAKFDGLMIFANVEKITPDAEAALLSYVENGGGLIPVHCASFCFLNSDKYISLVGGQFKRHGFTRFQTTIVNQNHPIMQGLQAISSEDESYMHAKHNSDRVVLETRSAESGQVSDPNGEPYTWVRESGKGRVFYTAWGHDTRTWSNVGFQQLLARGILWACGKTLDTVVVQDNDTELPKAVSAANRPFKVPALVAPTIDNKVFTFTDVGAKIPNYTPGARWGTQAAPLTLMQNPLQAEESVKAYQLPKDFHLSLWAKESNDNWQQTEQKDTSLAGLKGKPIAMNWDERGRLWISETIDYPNDLQPAIGQGRDRIKICEDTDNDGHADTFTVFAEHLSIPSTLVCYRGGVIVQDGQKTIYLKDVDGDDRSDFRQELITGWAMGDTHGGVSNFQYGPDNWIWAMQGYNNSEPVINGNPQMRFRQGFWRFKPRAGASDKTAPAFAISKETGLPEGESSDSFNQHTIRVDALEFMRATNNNTWGLGFSEEGYVFGSTANGCPSVHMAIPNRYYDKVAGWSPKTLERISPTNNFIAIEGETVRQVDNHGGYTAAAGSAIYTARNYPSQWWNKIQMICEPTAHLIGGFVLDKNAAGYKSNNTFSVIAGIDDWQAPIMAEVGPDGNVWVIDWYNYIVQHNPTPNGFKTGKGAAYESDLRDKKYGRIYRLLFANENSSSKSLDLGKASSAELVEALKSNNFFWRRTAQRLLVERAEVEKSILDALVALTSDQSMDEIGLNTSAMHAIWTLAGLAETGNHDAKLALSAACDNGFKHSSSPVRNAAASSCELDQITANVAKSLMNDTDDRVRLAVMLRIADGANSAVSSDQLADLSNVERDDILLDAWTSAAATNPVATLVAVVNKDAKQAAERLSTRVAVLAEHVARSSPTTEQVESLLNADPESALSVALWEGLSKGWPKDLTLKLADPAQQKLYERYLGESASIEVKAAILAVADKWSIANLNNVVSSIQDKLFATALDPDAEASKRLAAWSQAIKLAPQSERIVKVVNGMFTPQLEPDLGSKALDSLQIVRVQGLAKQLLAIRGKLGPKMAGGIVTLLLARADTTEELLDAIAEGQVQFSDLQLDQRQAILNHPTKEIAARAKELMEAKGAMVASNRQALVNEWLPVTAIDGNLDNGIAMFKKHCALCHRHGELGVSIGPNLTGMAVHPKEEILMNVLDPSRSVENNFRTYQILTTEGAVFNGMLAGESANAMRLINSQGKEEQILRKDIDEMNASVKSLMPEGFESLMTKQEMADLLTFLSNRGKYTPIALSSAATLSGTKGLPGFRNAQGDKFEFKTYGNVSVEGIPFELQDPQEGRVANIIALQSARGRVQTTLPTSATIPCSGKVSAIHLLAALQTFGPLGNRADDSSTASLVVRCVYEDGSSVDHELFNGKQLATYREKVDVPESKFALDADGKQVRFLSIPTDCSKPMKSIEFIKGEDFSIPLIVAITVESSVGEAH